MSKTQKSETISRFLEAKKPSKSSRSLTPKKINDGKNKIEATGDGNINIELASGDHIKGRLDSGMQVTGPGHLIFEDLEFGVLDFQGNFNRNKPDGFGQLNLEHAGLNYKGNFANNKVEGVGRLNSNDYIYYGQWISNKFNGYGRIMKRNFALYEGLFSKDNREGYGVEIYRNSDVYVGEFKKDFRCGVGTYFFYKGGYYYGFFKDNTREGFGVLYNKRNQQIYKGYWKADKKEGRGMEFYKNESNYNGYFENDMRSGVGFMEYSKSLVYMGEWRNNLKHGTGKLDVGKKSITGKFINDEIVDSCYVDASKFADKINNNYLEESIEEHLKNINYTVKDTFLRGLHDLYKILKDSLVEFVLKLVETGVSRLKVYILLKNLFSKAAFENILDDIKIFLKYEPNMYYLENIWETSIAEIFRDKTDYKWNIWTIEESVKTSIFNERQFEDDNRIRGQSIKSNSVYVFNMVKTEDALQLIITNRIAKGENAKCDFEGVLSNRGFELRYYSKETGEYLRNVEFTIYPFFITMNDQDNKYMISMKLVCYSGEFFFYNDNNSPLNLMMFLGFDSNDNIYSVGLDVVGSYVIAGEFDKQKTKGRFIQRYYHDYKIEYDAFLITDDKIQGYWNTTNINGQFILRKNSNFKLSREVAALMEIVFKELDIQKTAFDITKITELDSLLTSSIVAVIVAGSQGGIPQFGGQKREDEDLNLFEKYKKKNEEDNLVKSNTLRKRTNSNQTNKESRLSNGDITRILSAPQRDSLIGYAKPIITNNHQQSIGTITEKSEEILKSALQGEDDHFRRDLSKALKRLKQAESIHYRNWQQRFDPSSQSISWVGHTNMLGKEELFVIDNLYILNDRIEGLYVDEREIGYELAGSYSTRTKKFEIIGLSHDKTKTIKFIGEFKDFQLIGTLSKRAYNGPQESFEAKMFGYDAKCDIKNTKDEVDIDHLDCIIKITDNYLYAIVLLDKDYLFLNGYKNKGHVFNIDVNTTSKRVKNCKMTQIVEKVDGNTSVVSDVLEKKLEFSSDDIRLCIRY